VAGFHAAGDPEFGDGLSPYMPKKLYYHTFPRKLFKWFVRLMPLVGRNPRKFGRNQDIDLVEITEQDFPVHATLDIRSSTNQATKASNCHASQLDLGTQSQGILGWIFNLTRRRTKDTFMRAYPAPDPKKVETDLFTGVFIGESAGPPAAAQN
jgi:hypothetical protein